jgi:uncharacterized protein YcbX
MDGVLMDGVLMAWGAGPQEPQVVHLYRYPVKGLSAEPLDSVELTAGRGVPHDRIFALARPDTEFDEQHPVGLPKQRFLMLQRDERLALVRSAYDETAGTLTLDHAGTRLVADLGSADGRARIEDFFAALLADDCLAGRRPRLVTGAGEHRFTDAGPASAELMQAVSVVNLASVRDVAGRIGAPVHHLRFRANIYIDGVEPWAEFGWVGAEIGLGAVRARILRRTPRCAATTVNPDTGERDISMLRELETHYGHIECGCYVTICSTGVLRPGDPVTPPPVEARPRTASETSRGSRKGTAS